MRLPNESSTGRLSDEFRRRRRTLACGLRFLLRSPQLFAPTRQLFAWILCSHKLLRYLAAYGVLGLLLGAATAKSRGYRLALLLQLLGYLTGLLGGIASGAGRSGRVAALPLYGLTAQVAAILAPFELLRRQPGQWTRTPRTMGLMHEATGEPPASGAYPEGLSMSDGSPEPLPERPDAAASSLAPTACPSLGLAEDRASHTMFVVPQHRCYAAAPPSGIPADHQAHFCLTAAHRDCRVFQGQPLPWRQRPARFTRPLSASRRLLPSHARLGRRWLVALGLTAALIAVASAVVLARPRLAQPRSVAGDRAIVRPSLTAVVVDVSPTVPATPAPASSTLGPVSATPVPAATTVVPTASPAIATPATSRYTVQPGESLSELAERFGVSLAALAGANNLSSSASLDLG